MKKLIIFSFLVAAFMIRCNEADIVDNDQQVGISKVTYYPNLTLKGNLYETVVKGGTFTDPGITAEAGGAAVPVVVTGAVNTNAVGVYLLTYTATNTDGFSASTQRFVAVYSTDAGAAAQNFSGNYEKRTSNGSVAPWTKLAPGVYLVSNVGGAPTLNLTVIAFNPTGFKINIPSQPDNLGTTSYCTNSAGGDDITYNPGPPASYALIVHQPNFGTGLRTFVKQ